MDIKSSRSTLLLLKEKVVSFYSILSVLKARRGALIRELLSAIEPYLKSKEEIRSLLKKGLLEQKLSLSVDGLYYQTSLIDVNRREFPVQIESNNIYGLKYKEIKVYESINLSYDERKYSPSLNSGNLEEFENIVEIVIGEIIKLSNYENKLKIITEEVLKLNKKIRMLEDKIIPRIKKKIKDISNYLNERERENYFRLKLYKNKKPCLEGRV